MVKLESLKKSDHFKFVLKQEKTHTDYFSIFGTKGFIKTKKGSLSLTFIMKKKIGSAVKRNKIRRKLRAFVLQLLKKKSVINLNYTYIVFGKNKAYKEKYETLLVSMSKSFKKFN